MSLIEKIKRLKLIKQAKQIKENTDILKHGFFLSVLFIVLFIGVYLVSSAAFGWFSQNYKVFANGGQLSLEGTDIEIKYGVGELVLGEIVCEQWFDSAEEAYFTTVEENGVFKTRSIFSSLTPKDSVYICAKYKNNSEKDYLLDFRLVQGQEIPKVETVGGETVYAYFGSQLMLKRAEIYTTLTGGAQNLQTYTISEYLVPNPLAVSYFDSEITDIPPLSIASEIALYGGGEIRVHIEIEFVDNGKEQNLYQNFGLLGESSRFIEAEIFKIP